MSIKCHEFFGCRRIHKCPYYKYEGEKICWETENDLTPFVPAGDENKIVYCKNCLYYQHVNKIVD